LFLERGFFGGWFRKFGSARVFFVIVSFPRALVRRSGRRGRNGMSRIKVLV
jgi:hypothetical protein